MVIAPFELGRVPAIAFGEGALSRVAGILAALAVPYVRAGRRNATVGQAV